MCYLVNLQDQKKVKEIIKTRPGIKENCHPVKRDGSFKIYFVLLMGIYPTQHSWCLLY